MQITIKDFDSALEFAEKTSVTKYLSIILCFQTVLTLL